MSSAAGGEMMLYFIEQKVSIHGGEHNQTRRGSEGEDSRYPKDACYSAIFAEKKGNAYLLVKREQIKKHSFYINNYHKRL